MIYGVDVASYEGSPNWSKVKAAGISFAFSKVSQATDYVNPYWSGSLTGMLGLGSGFVPGAYHFLTQGSDPAAQARYFYAHLGGHAKDLAIALDVESTPTSRPTASQARAWVAEFKRLSGGHPVIGYLPGWYWQELGKPNLTFFDTLWQSHYVTGSGSPAHLYGSVQPSWWAAYGSERVSILQFTDKASVAGISGGVDASAFNGSVADLRALALGTSAPQPQPDTQEDDMPYGQLNIGSAAVTPIPVVPGAKTIRFFADNSLVGKAAPQLRVAVRRKVGWKTYDVVVDGTKPTEVVPFDDPATTDAVSVQRSDAGDVPVGFLVQ